MTLPDIKTKILNSKLAKDSFWSVFGNGFGSALLLLAGIIIARLLGSDVYGQYGVVKSTMLYIASFSSFGLSITSTKYVAEYMADNPAYVKSIIRACYQITLSVSIFIAILFMAFAPQLANWMSEPTLVLPLRYLGLIIICRSVNMMQVGILGGLKDYKKAANNNIISGIVMFALAIPLTYWFQLNGALISLLLSQAIYCLLNLNSIKRCLLDVPEQHDKSFVKELFMFSLPVAIQESTYFICQWGGLLILTKCSDLEQVGLFSAASQWNAIICFIPGMIYNVVISHLSSSLSDTTRQSRIINAMLLVNMVSTVIPCLLIWLFSGIIVNLYGDSFAGLTPPLVVLAFSAVFSCCANVYRSEFVAHGKNWLLMALRTAKDVMFLLLVYFLIAYFNRHNGALYYSWSYLITNIFYLLGLMICSRYLKVRFSNNHLTINN